MEITRTKDSGLGTTGSGINTTGIGFAEPTAKPREAPTAGAFRTQATSGAKNKRGNNCGHEKIQNTMMTDQEKIKDLTERAEDLRRRMVKAGWFDDENIPTAPKEPDSLDLEDELTRVQDVIKKFSKHIK